MLSPASLRVCCLAVMAPALTKADRRADCLPVVLPFCVPKTAASENRKDKLHNDFGFARFPSKFASLLKRKPFLQKSWLRTLMRNGTEVSDRHRPCTPDTVRKSPLSVKGRLHPAAWHGGSATLAVADKVRLKYTMNKSGGSIRNMGLAKANASLGYHNMRRMNRFTPLPHKAESSHLTQESGESSPELPDSTISELESPFRIVRIVKPVNEELMSSTKDDSVESSDCDVPPRAVQSNNDEMNHDKSSFMSVSFNNNKMSPHDTDLTDNATLPECSINVESRSAELTFTPMITSVYSVLPPSCDNSAGDTAVKELGDDSFLVQNSTLLSLAADVEDTNLHNISKELNLVTPLCPVPVHDAANSESLVHETLHFSPPGSPTSHLESDFETSSLNGSFSSSSTLSADASPLPSSLDEANDTVYITFPDSILASSSDLIEDLPSHELPDVSCLIPKSPLSVDLSAAEDRMRKKTCCTLNSKDYSKYHGMFTEIEERLAHSLEETETLMRKHIVRHANSQLRTLVGHLQRQSGIHCQKPVRAIVSKPTPKNIADLKAELLEREEVKHLSTQALVNFMNNVTSDGSPLDSLLLQKPASQEGETLAKEVLIPAFAAADCQDVKYTSNALLKSIKNLIKSADPDLTESSDDDSSDELEEDSAQKRALWKFLKERAVLTSRSTWLIARIHELENQLRTVTGVLKKLSVGELHFEEQVSSI